MQGRFLDWTAPVKERPPRRRPDEARTSWAILCLDAPNDAFTWKDTATALRPAGEERRSTDRHPRCQPARSLRRRTPLEPGDREARGHPKRAPHAFRTNQSKVANLTTRAGEIKGLSPVLHRRSPRLGEGRHIRAGAPGRKSIRPRRFGAKLRAAQPAEM